MAIPRTTLNANILSILAYGISTTLLKISDDNITANDKAVNNKGILITDPIVTFPILLPKALIVRPKTIKTAAIAIDVTN